MRLCRGGAGLLALSVLLSGCSGGQAVTSLKVGECFDDTVELRELGEVARVPSTPCDRPHDNEVFHLARYSGSTFDYGAISDFADAACFAAFEPYVGRSYRTSVLEFAWLMPTPGSWARGDREIVCVLHHMDLHKLRRSARDSGL